MKLLLYFFLFVWFSWLPGKAQDNKQLRYFMQSSSLPASKIQYGANHKAGHYLMSGDARIYYEVYGKGSPLVVLHGGIVGSSYEMGQFIDSLSRYYRVIAVSTRGHGKSSAGTGLPTYDQKAADVNAIINELTNDSVTVLGFSDGAYTGYFLAARYPEKVKQLIAIGAGEWKSGFRSFNNSRGGLFKLDSTYFKQQLRLMPEPQRFDEWLSKMNSVYNQTEVGDQIFRKINCKVLVMAGELDQNAPLETILGAYKMIPDATLSIIPNAPHPVFLTNFEAVWYAMKPFLKL